MFAVFFLNLAKPTFLVPIFNPGSFVLIAKLGMLLFLEWTV